MSLKQSIRRVLKENDYSPAGKEITPNSIVVHKSNPMFRDKIMSDGLKVKAGECYKIYVGYGTKCKPAIFATNSTNKRAWFDSTYDDDIWFIDTRMIPDVKWYKDRHFESTKKHIVTFQDIPREAITLHYEGTGRSEDLLQESIKRILKEEIDILSVRRRLYIVDDYIQNLSSKDICDYWVSDEVDNYVNETMAEIVRVMLDSTKSVNADNWHDIYEEIYEILIDLGYREKIEDFFYDSLDKCGKIIKEQSEKNRLIDLYITKRMESFTVVERSSGDKKGRVGRIEFVDKAGNPKVIIFFNRVNRENEVLMEDGLYGEIYNMFSMDGFNDIQRHLVKWFSSNFPMLKNIIEVYTFDNDEYVY